MLRPRDLECTPRCPHWPRYFDIGAACACVHMVVGLLAVEWKEDFGAKVMSVSCPIFTSLGIRAHDNRTVERRKPGLRSLCLYILDYLQCSGIARSVEMAVLYHLRAPSWGGRA